MSEAGENYEVFKDCLSSAVLERYAGAAPSGKKQKKKKMTKRHRKGSRDAGSSSCQDVREDGENDLAELAEFIEVNARLRRSSSNQVGSLLSEISVVSLQRDLLRPACRSKDVILFRHPAQSHPSRDLLRPAHPLHARSPSSLAPPSHNRHSNSQHAHHSTPNRPPHLSHPTIHRLHL